MRSLLEVAFGSAITTNDKGAKTTVIARQIGVGSHPQWELWLNWLMILKCHGDEDRLQGEQGDDWLLGGHGPDLLEGGLAQMFC